MFFSHLEVDVARRKKGRVLRDIRRMRKGWRKGRHIGEQCILRSFSGTSQFSRRIPNQIFDCKGDRTTLAIWSSVSIDTERVSSIKSRNYRKTRKVGPFTLTFMVRRVLATLKIWSAVRDRWDGSCALEITDRMRKMICWSCFSVFTLAAI